MENKIEANEMKRKAQEICNELFRKIDIGNIIYKGDFYTVGQECKLFDENHLPFLAVYHDYNPEEFLKRIRDKDYCWRKETRVIKNARDNKLYEDFEEVIINLRAKITEKFGETSYQCFSFCERGFRDEKRISYYKVEFILTPEQYREYQLVHNTENKTNDVVEEMKGLEITVPSPESGKESRQ
jgi:hypothetical protein